MDNVKESPEEGLKAAIKVLKRFGHKGNGKMVRKCDRELFDDLEAWSLQKHAFSINDFLKQKGISIHELENIADSSNKFMKIWGKAESRAWENVLNALFTKSLPRLKIAEYIKESDICINRDPEEVMHELESTQVGFELYLTAIGD